MQYVTRWGSTGGGDGEFLTPWGITTDPAGNVYVTDGGVSSDIIQKFTSTGTYIGQWRTDGPGGPFCFAGGITIDSAGNVYVTCDSRIRKFSSSGRFIAELNRGGSGNV